MASVRGNMALRPKDESYIRQPPVSSKRRAFLPQESREGYDHRIEQEMLANVPEPLVRDRYIFCQAPECSDHKGFQNRQGYMRHIKTSVIHAKEAAYRHTCPIPDCGISFARSDDLLRHQRSVHQISPALGKPGRPLKTFAKAVMHQLITSAQKEEPTSKGDSDEQPKHYLKQTREMSSESEIEPDDVPEPIFRDGYMFCTAPECRNHKGFHHRATYIRHIKTSRAHHNSAGYRHACTFPGCVSSFSRADDLLRHQRTIHQWDPRQDKSGPSSNLLSETRSVSFATSDSGPRRPLPLPKAGSVVSESPDPESMQEPVLYQMETPPSARPEEPREYVPKTRLGRSASPESEGYSTEEVFDE